MWSWLKWLVSDPVEEDNELIEENRILEEINKTSESTIIDREFGVVTTSERGFVEINGRWVASETFLTLSVGSLVSFIKPLNPESNVVTEVQLLTNFTQVTNLSSKDNYEGVISFIDDEKFCLNPGCLLVWKNDAEITFHPELGDNVKVEYFDGLLKLRPKECKVITDRVIKWDGKQGFLENCAKISLDICDEFYVPKVGDVVISCIISCVRNSYQWRSLNAIKVDHMRMKSVKVEVTNVPVIAVSVGEVKIIELFVKNVYYESLEVRSVKISPEISSVSLIENNVKHIEPAISVKYRISCKGESLGWTKFLVEFKFKNFIYNKSIKYFTSESSVDGNLLGNNHRYKRPLNFIGTSHLPNFLKIKPKSYELPKDLIEICKNSKRDQFDCISQIQQIIPELQLGLTMKTYSTYFHTLIFLEEISEVEIMEDLETVAPLIRRGEYYAFTFEDGTDYSRLVPGDSVLIYNPWVDDGEQISSSLTVSKKKDNEVYLKFKDIFNVICDRGTLFRMKFKPSRTGTIRTHHALDYFIGKIGVDWLFPDLSRRNQYAHNRPYISKHSRPSKCINYFFKDLDTEQRDAVINIVSNYDNLDYPYLVYGPPGTGKTITLVEATLQTLRLFPKCRILFAAPSNSAVDTYCELLLLLGTLTDTELIRVTGFNYSQQGQIPVNLIKYSAVLQNSFETQHELRSCDPEELCNYRIVAGTICSLGIVNCIGFRKGHFTHVFIDEAGQTTEPQTLIPLATMKPGYTRVVLAGDPSQLGPVVLSRVANAYQFGESLMRRLMTYPVYSRCFENDCSVKPVVGTMLRKNYRSLPNIVELISDLFYKKRLQVILGEGSREDQVLNNLRKTSFGKRGSSLVAIPVNGKEECYQHERNSYWNSMEAARVSVIILELYKIGLNSQQIGIITPYSMQVKYIRECLKSLSIEPPKTGTVEEFQGSERDIVIISLVRSIVIKNLGFINDPRRANVALSRAKVMNIVVANGTVFSSSELWKQVLTFFKCID